MEKYIMLEKAVGETPLSCAEAFRSNHPELDGVSMAYAGRLDPMASGKLLVLLGDECKNQTAYHGLDKEYEFSVLLGIGSDSHDVLGRLHTTTSADPATHLGKKDSVAGGFGWGDTSLDESGELQDQLTFITQSLTGNIELPYPHFSAKTVQGKPLHMWTLEGRLGEIEIPTKESTVYALNLDSIETKSRAEVCAQARVKIDSIPEVTEERKALGNDFRRVDVRTDWENILENDSLPDYYQIAHFTCTASSGTYMRTLAHLIGQRLSPPTPSLAWRIHRTKIGTFDAAAKTWSTTFE
jgi:tRNA U55 pseudouridine synthase TruB